MFNSLKDPAKRQVLLRRAFVGALVVAGATATVMVIRRLDYLETELLSVIDSTSSMAESADALVDVAVN